MGGEARVKHRQATAAVDGNGGRPNVKQRSLYDSGHVPRNEMSYKNVVKATVKLRRRAGETASLSFANAD